MKQISKKVKLSVIAAFITVSSIGLFGFVNNNYFELSKNLDIMSTLYREVNINYVDEVDPAKLMRTGMDAMLSTLDPYTNYVSEAEIEDYRFMTTGQYGGIGALITQIDNQIVISEPYEGSPAQKEGLLAGDIILAIDGRVVKGNNTSDVSKALKGTPNSTVELLIKRGSEKEFKKVITRSEINIKNVPFYGMIEPTIGYIKLTGFTQNAGEEVRNALVELKKNPAMTSVILDLRGNPGGLLHESVNVVNVFVERGQLVVTTKGKTSENNKSYRTLNNPVDTEIPLVVLTSSQSASASEIVSGAIQDLDRGIVIGQRTFGKGLVQSTRPLSYNTQLKLTVAKYYIPSGRCIQALDYSNRNPDGSVGKVPDSLMKAFTTKNGRKVFDGGGVAPDFDIPLNPYHNITFSLLAKRHIFNFATQYRLKNANLSNIDLLTNSDKEFNEFVKYLADKDYDYVTQSEKILDEYMEAAKKEKYFDAVKADFERLKKSLTHDKESDLLKNKEEIKSLLVQEIASRYFFQKGRIQASFYNDADLMKGLEVLKNNSLYSKTLARK